MGSRGDGTFSFMLKNEFEESRQFVYIGWVFKSESVTRKRFADIVGIYWGKLYWKRITFENRHEEV